MKRSVVALGLLGLVCAVAVPGASAAVCLQEDFSTDKLLKASGTYVQGLGLAQRTDPSVPPFLVRNGVLTSSPEGTTGGSDEAALPDTDPPGIRSLMLVGDPTWAN